MAIRTHEYTLFDDRLFNFVQREEATVRRIYSDPLGIPTLGVGFALFVRASDGSYKYRYSTDSDSGNHSFLGDSLSFQGINLTADDWLLLDQVLADLNAGQPEIAKLRIPTATQFETNASGGLEEPDAVSTDLNRFSIGLLDDGRVRSLYDIAMGETEEVVRTKLGNFADGSGGVYDALANSQELAALLSLAYTSPTLIGPRLTAALQNQDHSEAWYEIRYNSNAGGIHASRRYREADLFGLYNVSPIEEDYKAAYRTFTRHQEEIWVYETSNPPPTTIDYELRDARSWLVSTYVDLPGFGINIDGNILVGENDGRNGTQNTTYYSGTDGDVLTGTSQNDLIFGESGMDVLHGGAGDDVIYGGDDADFLYGEGDNDVLIGGAGADYLVGGAGNDTYYADQDDTIQDSDGKGSVYLNGKKLGIATRVGENAWRDSVGNTYTLNGTTLYVNDPLIIENFSIEQRTLGIYLDEAEDPANPPSAPVYNPTNSRLRRIDPLALDLDGDGSITTIASTASTAYFDFNNDGIAEKSGWIASQDGLLALDQNGNGVVDGLSELFGTATLDGFADLGNLDANSDGVIDAQDVDYANLKVWQDANSDGVSQSGELKSLAEWGIESIGLTTTAGSIPDADNLIGATSTYRQVGEDGQMQEHLIADVQFAVNFTLTDSNTNRPLGLPPELDSGIFDLPWLRGYGNVKSLPVAYQENPALRQAASNLIVQGWQGILQNFEGFMAKWTGLEAAHLAKGVTRTNLTIEDKVWMQETLTGQSVDKNVIETASFGALGLNWNTTYIESQYQRFLQRSALAFAIQATAKDWLKGAYYSLSLDRFVAIDSQALLTSLQAHLGVIDTESEALSAVGLLARLKLDGMDLTGLKQALAQSSYAELYASALDFSGEDIQVLTTAGTARLSDSGGFAMGSTGNDMLFGGAVNDVLLGGEGNDRLYGQWGYFPGGNDTLDGGAGDDYLDGGYDDDLLRGGDGNDTLFGSSGNDTLDGGAGNDSLDGSDGNDALDGMSGNDALYGGYGDDLLRGGDGNDTLQGQYGNDMLDGGAGNDSLNDTLGNDVFLFGRGDGQDTISSYDSNPSKQDIVQFKNGISPADVMLYGQGDNLVIRINGTQDQLTIQNYFAGDGSFNRWGIELIQLTDGTSWNLEAVKAMLPGPTEGNDNLYGFNSDDTVDGLAGNDRIKGYGGNDTLRGDVGDDQLYGGIGNDVLEGGTGNDTLDGGADNDTLDGGAGNDMLDGGYGNDTYLFGRGNGQDTILSYERDSSKQDIVQFKEGVLPTDVVVTHQGDFHLALKIAGTQDQLIAQYYFSYGGGFNSYGIEAIRFADGTSWDYATVRAKALEGTEGNDILYGFMTDDAIYGLGGDDAIYGSLGNDTLDGGAGNDRLDGGDGNDTYLFGRGDGQDWLLSSDTNQYKLDVVQFREGALPTDIVISRSLWNTDDLILTIAGTQDQLTVNNYFYNDGAFNSYGIELIRFADGTSWDYATVRAKSLEVTEGDDTIYGFGSGDVIDGLGGNDILHGLNGNDTLDGGTGNDTLDGGFGNDALIGGIGNDVLNGGSDNDTLDGGAGNDTLDGGFGNDTYLFGRGDGVDLILSSHDATPDKQDVVQFKEGVLSTDIALSRQGDNLTLNIVGTWDRLVIWSYFAYDGNFNPLGVEEIRFADGTSWDYAAIKEMLLKGTEGNDTLHGSSSADYIEGLGGNDLIYGYGGNDTLVGGLGNDTLYGDVGDDIYLFNRGDGQDRIVDGSSTTGYGDTIQFGPDITAADISLTRTDYDLIIGIKGTTDQLIIPWVYNNSAFEIEWVVFADGTVWDVATINDLVGTARGTDGADVLTGSYGWDKLYGLAGNDTLIGLEGNDILDGGTGVDKMSGGIGDDTYFVDNSRDSITENANEGVDTVYSSVSYTLSDNVENLTLSGTDAIDGIGNSLSNRLLGNAAANTLKGGSGNDYIDGGAGADTMVGGRGDDVFIVDDIGDTVTGGGGHDVVYSSVTFALSSGIEWLTLTGTADINGTGNNLDNWLTGNSGNNILDGGAGGDIMVGGKGDDIYVVDTAYGTNPGDKVIEYADSGNDTILSSIDFGLGSASYVENLTLTGRHNLIGIGNSLDNVLIGNIGSNALRGNEGNDYLDGGEGADTLIGGAGNDTYVFNRGYGNDVVQEDDTTAGNSDTAQVGVNPLDVVLARSGNDLAVSLHGGRDTLIVQNWYAGSQYQTEQFKASDGSTLLNTQVEQLIQAMATFSAQNGGITWDQAIDQRPDDVQAVLAANWMPAG